VNRRRRRRRRRSTVLFSNWLVRLAAVWRLRRERERERERESDLQPSGWITELRASIKAIFQASCLTKQGIAERTAYVIILISKRLEVIVARAGQL
jgi:hypothetical protein